MMKITVLSSCVLLASLVGCAADDGDDWEGDQLEESDLSSQQEALEFAGDYAPECSSDEAAELCGPESLTPSDDPLPPLATEQSTDKTIHGRSVIISASTTGAKVTANLVWVNDHAFELHNVRLEDTSCDDKSVYFHTHISGFQYPDHWNKKGCKKTATWSNLKGSASGPIAYVWLDVCRNKNPDNCKESEAAANYYYP